MTVKERMRVENIGRVYGVAYNVTIIVDAFSIAVGQAGKRAEVLQIPVAIQKRVRVLHGDRRKSSHLSGLIDGRSNA